MSALSHGTLSQASKSIIVQQRTLDAGGVARSQRAKSSYYKRRLIDKINEMDD